jgi:hypothetical protein
LKSIFEMPNQFLQKLTGNFASLNKQRLINLC